MKRTISGRRLKKWLRPDLWAELEGAYTGMSLADNWVALYNTIVLIRKTAPEVGSRLGYPYPEDMDRRMIAYLKKIENQGHLSYTRQERRIFSFVKQIRTKTTLRIADNPFFAPLFLA